MNSNRFRTISTRNMMVCVRNTRRFEGCEHRCESTETHISQSTRCVCQGKTADDTAVRCDRCARSERRRGKSLDRPTQQSHHQGNLPDEPPRGDHCCRRDCARQGKTPDEPHRRVACQGKTPDEPHYRSRFVACCVRHQGKNPDQHSWSVQVYACILLASAPFSVITCTH